MACLVRSLRSASARCCCQQCWRGVASDVRSRRNLLYCWQHLLSIDDDDDGDDDDDDVIKGLRMDACWYREHTRISGSYRSVTERINNLLQLFTVDGSVSVFIKQLEGLFEFFLFLLQTLPVLGDNFTKFGEFQLSAVVRCHRNTKQWSLSQQKVSLST